MSSRKSIARAETNCIWVFGYGSLIYKVDFPYVRRATASIRGWERRFWQGSHDHRGTPCSPGRVVTLIRSADAICRGVAYLVENHVLEQLDHREKNGYQRYDCRIRMQAATGETAGLVYVAPEHNPAYLGPADPAEVAAHIARSAGPSGSNSEYLLRLARALRELGDEDEHVLGLEALLLAGPGTPPQATLPGDSRHDRTTVAAAANSAAITTDQST